MKMSQMAWIRWGLVVLLLAVPACLGAAGGADVDVDETDVVVLTESNFKDELNKAKYALVRWCWGWRLRVITGRSRRRRSRTPLLDTLCRWSFTLLGAATAR